MSATIIKVGEVGQLKFSQAQKTSQSKMSQDKMPQSKMSQGLCIIEGTPIAGTRHVANIADIAQQLIAGERLVFERDPENIYDAWSVRVYGHDHVRLGYVSCDCNEVVARLLDGGHCVSGRLERVSHCDSWTRIDMGVYLDD